MRVRMTIILLALAGPASAQPEDDPALFEVEARSGIAIGAHSSTWAGLEFLPRLSADLLVRRNSGGLSVFGAGSFVMFGCADGFCTGPSAVVINMATGVVGFEIDYSQLWFRAGAGGGLSVIRGEPETGFAVLASAGARVPLGPLSISPGTTVRWLQGTSRAFAAGVDLGISYRLGGR